MTLPHQSRGNVTRIIASSLCFDQDPPVIRNLAKAREAAGEIYDALVGAGIIPPETESDPGEYAGVEIVFPPNGLATVE